MDNQLIMQMMQSFLPPVFRDAAELQQLILSHAAKGGESWQIEMLEDIKPRLPEQNQHMVDVLIKCMELAMLLKKQPIS